MYLTLWDRFLLHTVPWFSAISTAALIASPIYVHTLNKHNQQVLNTQLKRANFTAGFGIVALLASTALAATTFLKRQGGKHVSRQISQHTLETHHPASPAHHLAGRQPTPLSYPQASTGLRI